MTIYADLESLINSMSKSEKRHFNIYAARHVKGSKNVYMKLFEHIEKKKKYDVAAIQKAFAGESFLKWLPAVNNYLYTLILKSLRVYHSNKTVSLRIKEMLEYVEILHGKTLYAQCEKVIRKAKRLAQQYEMPLEMMECLKWEDLTTVELGQIKNTYSVQKEQEDALAKHTNFLHFQGINTRLFSLVSEEGRFRRDAHFWKKLEEMMKSKLLDSEKNALSFSARTNFYNVYSIYHRTKGNAEKSHYYRKKQLDLWDSNRLQINENKMAYISTMCNLIIGTAELKRHDEALQMIYTLRALPLKTPNIANRIFTFSYSMELAIYNETGSFEKGIKIISYVEEKLQDVTGMREVAKLSLYLNIMTTHFGAANYKKALFWVNKILNDEHERRIDIYYFARIFSLIVHFEMGNKELLEYISKSSHRFLDKKERIYKFETLIFSFFKKNLTNDPQKNLTNELKKLWIALMNLEKDPQEKKIFEYFDFISWVESKIQNRSFADIVREKVK